MSSKTIIKRQIEFALKVERILKCSKNGKKFNIKLSKKPNITDFLNIPKFNKKVN